MFVEHHFGKIGAGEGIVLYPMHCSPQEIPALDRIPRGTFSLVFKAKVPAHREQKSGKKIKVPDPSEEAFRIAAQEFAANFCTSARCEKGIFEVCGSDDLSYQRYRRLYQVDTQ